jgi:sugar/nucleoside kinase (ribokinase family)
LHCARIVKASERELQPILAYYHQTAAELVAQFAIRELIVTQGSGGGYVRTAEGSLFRYRAEPVDITGDPTGAGDVFLAAYAIRRMLRNDPIPAALRYSARLAAAQVAGVHITEEELKLPPATKAK